MPGEVLFTRNHWAKLTHVSEGKIRVMMDAFEKDSMIALRSVGNAYTIVKIVNWCAYQSEGVVCPFDEEQPIKQPAEQPKKHQRKAALINDYSSFVTNGIINETTNETANGEPTIYKNIKNIRNKEDIDYTRQIQEIRMKYSEKTLSFIDRFTDILRTTRKSNKMADSVLLQIYEQMVKYPEIVIQYGCSAVINNPALHSKKENYFFGILRNTSCEEAAYKMEKGDTKDGKTIKPNGSGYDTRKIVYSGPINDDIADLKI